MQEGRYIISNGKTIEHSEIQLNRGFWFGDGLFETIRVINGMPFNAQAHYERLVEGLSVLHIELPVDFSYTSFYGILQELISANGITFGAKIKFAVYRGGKGTYKPENNFGHYVAEISTLESNFFELNAKGLSIDVYNENKKQKNSFNKYKTLNSLLYVLASEFAQRNNFDDALLINDNLKIVEATSSNIFLVSNGVLYTPPLDDSCVGGTMRMTVINTALENKVTVYESSISQQHLLVADEVFLTNAIQGIKWVGSFKNKRYYHEISKKLLQKINEKELKPDSSSLKNQHSSQINLT